MLEEEIIYRKIVGVVRRVWEYYLIHMDVDPK